jgi:hypothetical protein
MESGVHRILTSSLYDYGHVSTVQSRSCVAKSEEVEKTIHAARKSPLSTVELVDIPSGTTDGG